MRVLAIWMVAIWPVLATAQETGARIAVSGTGVVSTEPDMAVFYMGVAREGRTAAAAMEATNQAATAVLDAILTTGIESRDVQTASINLSPIYDQSNARPRQIRGYVATNDLTVRVRDLDGLGGLLDAVVGDGANMLNGLSFAIADPEPLQTEARAAAVRDARAKAETLAEAAGVRLGRVLSITEGGGFVQPGPMMRSASLEAAPVARGEVDTSVTVNMEFAIEDGS